MSATASVHPSHRRSTTAYPAGAAAPAAPPPPTPLAPPPPLLHHTSPLPLHRQIRSIPASTASSLPHRDHIRPPPPQLAAVTNIRPPPPQLASRPSAASSAWRHRGHMNRIIRTSTLMMKKTRW